MSTPSPPPHPRRASYLGPASAYDRSRSSDGDGRSAPNQGAYRPSPLSRPLLPPARPKSSHARIPSPLSRSIHSILEEQEIPSAKPAAPPAPTHSRPSMRRRLLSTQSLPPQLSEQAPPPMPTRPSPPSSTHSQPKQLPHRPNVERRRSQISTSRDPSVNWLSSAPTPVFSRHHLGSNVVMPLTADQLKRRNSKASVRSTISAKSTASPVTLKQATSADKKRFSLPQLSRPYSAPTSPSTSPAPSPATSTVSLGLPQTSSATSQPLANFWSRRSRKSMHTPTLDALVNSEGLRDELRDFQPPTRSYASSTSSRASTVSSEASSGDPYEQNDTDDMATVSDSAYHTSETVETTSVESFSFSASPTISTLDTRHSSTTTLSPSSPSSPSSSSSCEGDNVSAGAVQTLTVPARAAEKLARTPPPSPMGGDIPPTPTPSFTHPTPRAAAIVTKYPYPKRPHTAPTGLTRPKLVVTNQPYQRGGGFVVVKGTRSDGGIGRIGLVELDQASEDALDVKLDNNGKSAGVNNSMKGTPIIVEQKEKEKEKKGWGWKRLKNLTLRR